MTCNHLQVHWTMHTTFFDTTNVRYLDIRGACETCGAVVSFRGQTFGVNPAGPTLNDAGAEATLPYLFEGEQYDGGAIGFISTSVGGKN